MEQVVAFVANKDGPPAISPGARIALKLIGGILGIPSALAVLYVTFMDVSFLAGSAATPLGNVAGVVGGIVAALGLSMLLVAVGVTRKEMPIVAVMALGLFGLCLVIALSAMGSFTWVTSQPMRPGAPIELPRFDNEPRQIEAIDQDIIWFRNERIERPGKPGRVIVTDGDEILDRTENCTRFSFNWERSRCEQWRYLLAEKAARERMERKAAPHEDGQAIPGSGVVLTASEIRFGHYFSSAWSHIVIVAFASVGFAITLACGYILTKVEVPALPLPAPGSAAAPKDQMTIMKEGFDAWRKACVGNQDGNVLRAQDVYDHYTGWVTRALGMKAGDILANTTFGELMRGVATTVGKASTMKYGGIAITDSLGIWNGIEKMNDAEQ